MASSTHPDHDLIALGIQQPWAELILRGVKTLEIRSTATRVRGPIYLYASRRTSSLEAATTLAKQHDIDIDGLPKGLLVGTVEIIGSRSCTAADTAASGVPADLLAGREAWELSNPVRLEQPLPVRFLPYGVWFYPFRRKQQQPSST